MKISEMIETLRDIKKSYGDVEVYTDDSDQSLEPVVNFRHQKINGESVIVCLTDGMQGTYGVHGLERS